MSLNAINAFCFLFDRRRNDELKIVIDKDLIKIYRNLKIILKVYSESNGTTIDFQSQQLKATN